MARLEHGAKRPPLADWGEDVHGVPGELTVCVNHGTPTTPVAPASVQVITTGGMAGWQIILIALGPL
jgi:hypothetical protein